MKKLILGVSLLIIGVSLFFFFGSFRGNYESVKASPEIVTLSESPPDDLSLVSEKALALPQTETAVSVFDSILNLIQKLFSVVSTGLGLYITFCEVKKRLPKRIYFKWRCANRTTNKYNRR